MKAIVCERLGGPEVLRLAELERPQPGPGEVLVRVRASSANFADLLMVAGRYQVRPPLPFVPGLEFSGEVAACGPGAGHFAVGQRVMGAPAWGAFAEYVAVPQTRVFALPAGMDDEAAAAFPVAFGTAGHALQARADLRAGETVLVTGAAGGVGTAALQVAKRLQARVIAAVGSAAKADIARQQGADEVVRTDEPDWPARCKQIAHSRGVDVVLDTVGGEVFAQALKATAPWARVLVVGFASGQLPRIPAEYLLLKNLAVHGIGFGGTIASAPAMARSTFEALARLHAQQPFAALAGQRHPLEQTPAALAALADRSAVGKQLIFVSPS